MADSAWTIEPFDRGKHNRAGFDCGVPLLNDWLATKISQYEKKGLARTFVLVERGSNAVKGYYALSNHTIVYDALGKDQSRGLPSLIDVPVVLLGRLAVDRSLQGQKLGGSLLIDALCRVERLSRNIGIRAVEVYAINEKAKQFYEKYGFLSLRDNPRHLYLPIAVIRKLIK